MDLYEGVQVSVGIRQWNRFSPILFNIIIDPNDETSKTSEEHESIYIDFAIIYVSISTAFKNTLVFIFSTTLQHKMCIRNTRRFKEDLL